MKQKFGMAWLVTKRELIDQMRDWRILAPMIVLTAFFPYLMTVTARFGINYLNQYGATIIGQQILPFLMLVVGFFPVTVSLVVALEAFVGEKERGTIEPLLTSPLEDWQLYLGKLMAGIIIPLSVSYLGIALYFFGLSRENISWPDASYTIQTLALTAVQTVLMVSAAIVVSTQSTTVRSANLLASFIVIPVALLVQGESGMMFSKTNDVLWFAVLGVAILAALTVRLGLVHFKRESLLGREIDMLNASWAIKTFWRAFSGSDTPPAVARYLLGRWKMLRGMAVADEEVLSLPHAFQLGLQDIAVWYRVEIPRALRKISATICVTVVIGLAAAVIGYVYVDQHVPAGALSPKQAGKEQGALNDSLRFFTQCTTAQCLFFNNFRAEMIISALGIVSFGVLGMIAYIGNFAFIGGVLSISAKSLGVSPLLIFLTGILPHGIFELPSIILVSSAVLHAGLTLVTPKDGRSIGEAFLISIADLLKIVIGVCIPLLFVAAMIEGWITPRLLAHFFGEALSVK